MKTLDTVVSLTLAVVLIVGGYQFYFWCQRRTQARGRVFSTRVDDAIRLRPWWVWIYSGIYYPAIAVVVMSSKDLRSFNYMAFSYLLLLVLQMSAFLLFPVEVPRTGGNTIRTIALHRSGFWRSFSPSTLGAIASRACM